MYFANSAQEIGFTMMEIDAELSRQMRIRPGFRAVYKQKLGEDPDSFLTVPAAPFEGLWGVGQ